MVWVVRDVRTFDGEETEVDRYLDIVLDGVEWGALFYDELRCPKGIDEPYQYGQDLEEWKRSYVQKFRQAIPDSPMLARIWDMYIDVGYEPGEVAALFRECTALRARVSNDEAQEWLSKMLSACHVALQQNLGVYLACD